MSGDRESYRVSSDLLERILSGAYPPGLRLPSEVELASEFGCGRSTIREALRRIMSLGLLETRRGSGAVVLDYRTEGQSLELLGPWLTGGQLNLPVGTVARELLRMRTLFAAEAVRLAALYAAPGGLEKARAILEHSRSLESDPQAHSSNDLELHRALVNSSGVLPAVWLSNNFRVPLGELSSRLPIALVPARYYESMSRLLDLIEARDEDAAVALIRDRLDAVDHEVLSRLGVH